MPVFVNVSFNDGDQMLAYKSSGNVLVNLGLTILERL